MPDGSIIGTSSSRRSAILREYYPKLQIKLLRGNLNTRVNKLDNGEYDAIILAQAGVVRLGWGDRIKQQLPLDIFIPAIGQGALAIELRDDSKWQDVISRLYCTQTSTEVSFERKVGAYLNADCSTPLGCFVVEHNGNYQVSAFIRLDNKPYKKLEYIYHDGNSDELHSLITSTLC